MGVFWGDVRFSIILFYMNTYIYFFSFVKPTGQTPERILMHNIPKHADHARFKHLGLK